MKQRQSNFELLRIIAMLLVLLAHYVPTRENGLSSLLSLNTMDIDNNLNVVCNLILRSLGIVCVHCFILISGYWGIRFKLKSFTNLLFQMFFWSFICIVIAKLTYSDLSGLALIKTFVGGIVYGWFPEAYLILFVVSPILNSFIKSCSEKEFGKYILYFYLLSTIGGYLLGFQDYRKGMSALSLVGLYLIGAYLRVSNLRMFRFKVVYDMAIYLCLSALMVVISLILPYLGISFSIYGYLNPIVILMSIYLFLFFKKIDIGYSKVINFFSASAFSIYLFHCNVLLGSKVAEMWVAINSYFGVFSSIFIAMLSFLVIYLVCTLVDQVRIFIYRHVVEKYLPS